MIIIVETEKGEEFRYESDHVPAIGDRVVSDYLGYRVTGRTWYVDRGMAGLWVEIE